jgi:hypothetical protein
MSVANVAFWGVSFGLGYAFPALLDDAGNGGLGKQGTFAGLAALSFATAAFVGGCLVETRGRSLGDIEALVVR